MVYLNGVSAVRLLFITETRRPEGPASRGDALKVVNRDASRISFGDLKSRKHDSNETKEQRRRKSDYPRRSRQGMSVIFSAIIPVKMRLDPYGEYRLRIS